MQKLFWIALAGALGTLARYGMSGAVQRWAGIGFPWGTASVNILGCFLFGIVWALAAERNLIHPDMRTAVLVGFMGGFTTFSSFIYDTGQLLSDWELLLGFGNVALQVTTGLAVFYLGLALGRAV